MRSRGIGPRRGKPHRDARPPRELSLSNRQTSLFELSDAPIGLATEASGMDRSAIIAKSELDEEVEEHAATQSTSETSNLGIGPLVDNGDRR